jgi:hypothetical protein
MKVIAREMFEMVRGSALFDTMVRKRNPPRCCPIVCVSNPLLRGARKDWTPSEFSVATEWHESSDWFGLMNSADSVNEKENWEDDVASSMVNDKMPPT